MRLTLRTLLAYLDDILPAADTKEIGEKIAASPVATQLVERIRDVNRRRRITAPAPDGTGGGIDPNLMSEYLDNGLPPNLVADVERICLESDINLAEAAACHQVLTLILGEPVTISEKLRERMYALGPGGTVLDVPDAPPPSKNVRETNAREQLSAIQASEKSGRAVPAANRTLESRLPDYLRKPPLWKRVLPWAALLLFLGLWAGWLLADPTLFGIRQAEDEPEPQDQQVAQADRAEAPTEQQSEPPAPAPKPIPEQTDTTTEPPIDPPPPAEEVPLMADAGQTDSTEPAVEETVPPEGESIAAAAQSDAALPVEAPEEETSQPAAATPDSPTEEPAQPAASGSELKIASRRGVPLYQQQENELWYPVPADENPPQGSPVAVPVPFEAEVTLGDSPLSFTILSGTRLVPLEDPQVAPVGIDLVQGRLRVAAQDSSAAQPENMRFALRLADALWRVEPLSPDTQIGIEAQPLQPTEPGQDLTGQTPQGIIYVNAGSVRLAASNGSTQTIEAGDRAVLSPGTNTGQMAEATAVPDPQSLIDNGGEPPAEQPEENADDEGTTEAQPTEAEIPTDETSPDAETPVADAALTPDIAGSFPDWLVPQQPTDIVSRGADLFAAEFLAGVPVDESLLPAVNDNYYLTAQHAAQGLALIENVDGMLKTLRDSDHLEARLAAFQGLRNWLGRSPEHGEQLRESLRVVFGREDLVETLDRLLWGFDSEDARELAASQQLVAWLDHPQQIVRELAFQYVYQFSGRTFDYRPIHDAGRRASSVNRWQDFIARNGGLLPQE